MASGPLAPLVVELAFPLALFRRLASARLIHRSHGHGGGCRVDRGKVSDVIALRQDFPTRIVLYALCVTNVVLIWSRALCIPETVVLLTMRAINGIVVAFSTACRVAAVELQRLLDLFLRTNGASSGRTTHW